MDEVLPWYRAMPAENRSWVSLVAQAGIAAFVEWFRAPGRPAGDHRRRVRHRAARADPGGDPAADRRAGPGRRSTWSRSRSSRSRPGDEAELREAVLRYSREIAFAAAQVYAQAAEARGAWDARLEALVVDALLRGEADDSLRSRAAALGWGSHDSVVVVVGQHARRASPKRSSTRSAGRPGPPHLDVLTGVQGDRLVVILGGDERPGARHPAAGRRSSGPARWWSARRCPTCWRPARSAAAALAGLRAAPRLAGRAAPGAGRRPAARAGARRRRSWPASGWCEEIYRPLQSTGTALVETLSAYLEQAASLEATARVLFVHPNTVRYRLRRVDRGHAATPRPTRGRRSTLRMALALGRLGRRPAGPRPAYL